MLSQTQLALNQPVNLPVWGEREWLKWKIFQDTILNNPYIVQKPTPKQAEFLLCDEREVLFGGAAGPGKSSGLLMAAAQYVQFPNYNALILRKSYRDLALAGALIDRAKEWWLGKPGVHWNEQQHVFTFPSGATVQFGYLESENDKFGYQGAEFQFVGFDELTQFSESKYLYLSTRLRRLQDSFIPLRLWSASNPGGVGHTWVKQRFIASPSSDRRFVSARLEDNPYLDRENYLLSLNILDPVTYKQFRHGDWDVVASFMFKPVWFLGDTDEFKDRRLIEQFEVPNLVKRVRWWDYGGTIDPLVGLLAGWDSNGFVYLLDCKSLRGTAHEKEVLITQCALQDKRDCYVGFEQEPGSMSKDLIDLFTRKTLAGYNVVSEKPSEKKHVRATPFANSCQRGHVKMVKGDWNGWFLDELAQFPYGEHDEAVDTGAYCFNFLTRTFTVPYLFAC